VLGTELAPVVPLRAPGEDEAARLRRAIDMSRLIEVGYDPGTGVIRLRPGHPVLGYEVCPVAGCTAPVLCTGLCDTCRQRFIRFDGTREEFLVIPRVFAKRREQRLCLVCCTSGHERPASRRDLCDSCESARRARGQTVEEYVATARPRPSKGRCARCERWADFERVGGRRVCLCRACYETWSERGKPNVKEFAVGVAREAHGGTRGIQIDLSVLCERLRLEVLCGFQRIWMDGGYARCGLFDLQGVVDELARVRARSLLDELVIGGRHRGSIYRRLRVVVEFVLADPEGEVSRDVWRLGVLRPDGGRQVINYTTITQWWLRELVKEYNRQRLVSHAVGFFRRGVYIAAELSRVLSLREDRGENPSVLARRDVVDFLMHLRARAQRGELSSRDHRASVTRMVTMLREARDRGLHRQPGPLHALADEFMFYDTDIPRGVRRDLEGEPERALPQAVIDQLLAPEAIALLHETAGEAVGCAVELQMRTGRRPQEIAHAPFRCLEHEQRVREDGKLECLPVFVYRPEKRPKTRKELPIFAEERRLIKRMQALARERFPDADPNRLPLVPRQRLNRDGRKPLPESALSVKMRHWVKRLGELVGPDGEPFDRAKVFPYAFRHSYAQRLADQGASESELMDLMDHDSFETTRGYFRIRAERRRRAAELGRKALFDNQGRRLMRGLEQLAEAERTRMQLGSLAVPYGACVEPANVASMGGACKFMLKCLGCKHFRTDLSHLPALEAYERQLVAARERLLAETEVDGLEDWARQGALAGSQEELDRVRYLIGRIREAMEELTPAERAELHELLAGERTNRSAILERLPARHELNVLNAGATFDGVAD
jgi:integrase